jgi:hypothetical protein
METQLEQLILQELQQVRNEFKEFRTEVTAWKVELAAQVAEHETKIIDICGNGQPGRMSDAEDDISALKRSKYWLVGWSTGVAGVIAAVFETVRWIAH